MIRKAVAFFALSLAPVAFAAVESKPVIYKAGTVELEGTLAYDSSKTGKRPVVIVVHDWMGNGEFSKRKIEDLARLGYVGFAVDIYGRGIRPKSPAEAGKLAGSYKSNRKLMRERVEAGLQAAMSQPMADKSKVAAMGFCFGGTAALELARSGAPVLGTVSFHGGLETPNPQDAKQIRGKILALHGADDPNVPEKDVLGFQQEMRAAKVDWQLVSYGNAVHAFTNPAAGNDNSKGSAYNELADRRSWLELERFLAEVFKG